MSEIDQADMLSWTAEVVAGFVSNNSVRSSELPELISSVHTALLGLGASKPEAIEETKPTPAISIKKSISDDFIICLEDGKKFKSLKRHLASAYSMSPDEYRAKWSLPRDYPMVAPSYASARSSMAKQMGLGRKPDPIAAAPQPVPDVVEPPVVKAKPKRKPALKKAA